MSDEDMEKIFEDLHKIKDLEHDSFDSKIIWSKSSKPSPTKEMAIDQSRADAIKKGKPFKDVKGTDLSEAEDRAINIYIDDFLGDMF